MAKISTKIKKGAIFAGKVGAALIALKLVNREAAKRGVTVPVVSNLIG